MSDSPDSQQSLQQGLGGIPFRLVAVSVVGSLCLIAFLSMNADWKDVFSMIDIMWLAKAVVAMVLLQFLSGARLYNLIGGQDGRIEHPFFKSVRVMFVFQALLKLLPFRLGEVAFFWIVRKELGTPFRDNLGVFLNFRIWDLRIVAVSFLLFGGLLLRDKFAWGQTVFWIVGGFGVMLFALSSYRLVWLGELFFRSLHRSLPVLKAQTGKIADVLGESAGNLKEGNSLRSSVVTGLLSLLVWGVYFGVFYSLFQCVGIHIAWPMAVIVVSGTILVGILPIQTLGGIGLLEMGQASLLTLAGLSSSVAAAKSLAVGALFLGLCLAVPGALYFLFDAVARVRAVCHQYH